ncbi:MAG TPA: hypothetical protein VLB50_07375 [Ignavibacteriaceae bacterium]|nr:hypothetical protein [Ignavibacteriaceae bacterium]
MFRAVKEIAGTEGASLENAEGIESLEKRFHKIPIGEEYAPHRWNKYIFGGGCPKSARRRENNA